MYKINYCSTLWTWPPLHLFHLIIMRGLKHKGLTTVISCPWALQDLLLKMSSRAQTVLFFTISTRYKYTRDMWQIICLRRCFTTTPHTFFIFSSEYLLCARYCAGDRVVNKTAGPLTRTCPYGGYNLIYTISCVNIQSSTHRTRL